eukprot:2612461-Ditylum_brightwellii.AAC.1
MVKFASARGYAFEFWSACSTVHLTEILREETSSASRQIAPVTYHVAKFGGRCERLGLLFGVRPRARAVTGL